MSEPGADCDDLCLSLVEERSMTVNPHSAQPQEIIWQSALNAWHRHVNVDAPALCGLRACRAIQDVPNAAARVPHRDIGLAVAVIIKSYRCWLTRSECRCRSAFAPSYSCRQGFAVGRSSLPPGYLLLFKQTCMVKTGVFPCWPTIGFFRASQMITGDLEKIAAFRRDF